MSAKNIGTIKTVSRKSIGRFYRASSSREDYTVPNSSKSSLRHSRKTIEDSSNRKRANSVGKIYTTSTAQRRQLIQRGQPRKDLRDLINYEEMQQKLSNYLTCTIRTSNRQKYNYLSQHYTNNPDSQQVGKLRYCQNDIRPRTNILQLSENINHNAIGHRASAYPKPSKEQIMGKESIPNKQESVSRKQNTLKALSNKQNIHWFEKAAKNHTQKQAKPSALLIHQQNKSQLSSKLMKIIDNYENKNKQLSFELKKLEKKFVPSLNNKKEQLQSNKEIVEHQTPEKSNSEQLLSEIYSKLLEYNLKTTSLSGECDCKLEELWKSIHSQIMLDDKLRIIKAFVNEDNISQIVNEINSKRIKKIESSSLKTHSEQYDPFMVEQLQGFLKGSNLRLTDKRLIIWIATAFIKYFQESERHWLKYLSQEKMECSIRSMILQRQITGLRQQGEATKELNLRDFTRWLSTLYRGTLRNRNVYQIYHKIKDMSYIGRFIELLEEKAGRGSDLRKLVPPK